jgi:hypothetical protein
MAHEPVPTEPGVTADAATASAVVPAESGRFPAATDQARGLRGDGEPGYVQRGARGRLLNAGYLIPIAKRQQPGRKRGGKDFARPFELANDDYYPGQRTPRLYNYINGGSPVN